MGNVGVERRGLWEVEFSKDGRSIWVAESKLKLGKEESGTGNKCSRGLSGVSGPGL